MTRIGASVAATRAVFTHAALRRAVIAFAVATTADWAVTVAVGVIAFQEGGATAVGLIALARMLPSALVVPVFSVLADRARRDRILLGAAMIQGGAIGVAALLLNVDSDPMAVYALVVVATMANTVVRPTHSALLPSLCESTADLASATVATGLLGAVAAMVGPVITGALLATAGPDAVFGAAYGLCMVAVVALARIRYEVVRRPEGPRPHVGRELLDGIGVVARHRELRLVYAAVLAQTYVRGALNVVMVVAAFDLLDAGEAGAAALAGAFGVGGIVGSFAGSLLTGSRHLGRWLVLALAGWGIPIALIAGTDLPGVAMALVGLVGFANSMIDVPFFTLPVRLVDDAVLGRVFGVFESLVSIGVAAGSAATPALISWLGLRGALIATGALLPALGVVAWAHLSTMDERLAVRDTEIDALRASPMFAVLPVASIEQLATRLRPTAIEAGRTIVEQGDAADAAYVIVTGEAEVLGDGRWVRDAGPGDVVGEIALLRDSPRTATVRARTHVELLEMDRDAFLDAVTGHRVSRDTASSLADLRLTHFRPSGG
jgi:MFS family permease